MKQTTNKMVIALDINEIMYELQLVVDAAVNDPCITVDEDYLWEAFADLTIGEGLWEETDNDWFEIYQLVVEDFKNGEQF